MDNVEQQHVDMKVRSSVTFHNISGLRFTDTFLQLFCEKNSDGTKKLRFKGNELEQRFQERLCPIDVLYIGKFCQKHTEVTEIDLSYNNIEDEGLEHLCHLILKIPNNTLVHLNVSGCDISSVGIKTFYHTAMENHMKLKSLRLTSNRIGPEGGHLIALSLPFIPTLEYLDLGDTNQTVESIECIFDQVKRSDLKVLNVDTPLPATNLMQVDYSWLAETTSDLFRINQHLVEIHLQKCELDAHCIETMIVGLSRNVCLKFLDLGYNNICCVGVEFLSEWLKTRPNLLGLNIAGNNVRNHGGVALSFGMPFCKLRYLDISYNNIGNEGIIAILHTIKKPYMLRYFLLWGNKFSHPANKIIQRMMSSKVFVQEGIDVKIYCVDGVLHAARYPIDKYKNRYYGATEYACAVELKIKRNRVEVPGDKPRALVNFQHIDRFPPLGPKVTAKSDVKPPVLQLTRKLTKEK